MKLLSAAVAIALACPLFGQIKTIPNQEIANGSGVFLQAEMTQTLIEFTITGPSDRWFAIGIGQVMSNADAIIYTDGKVGAMHTEGIWDYDLNAQNANGVNKDAQDNLTVISNNVNGAQRTIVVSRPLNTGDPVDHPINFNDATLTVIWAKGNTADYTLAYHGGNRGSATFTWLVTDITPPSVAGAFTPADNATGISLGTNCVVSFNEAIAFGTGTIELREVNGGALVEQFDVSAPSGISISGSQLTIDPTNNLSALTDYYITINNGAIEDLAGNPFAGFTDATTWNFTTLDNTGDVIPPALVQNAFTPSDDAIGVAVDVAMLVEFTEDVTAGTGTISLYNASTGFLVESYDVASSANININGTTVTISPTALLSHSTDYYLLIDSTAIIDLSANPFEGITDPTQWNFTTEVNGLVQLSNDFTVTLLNGKELEINETSGISFSVQLYDNLGQTVYASTNIQNTLHIQLERAPSTVLYLRIESEKGQQTNKILLHD